MEGTEEEELLLELFDIHIMSVRLLYMHIVSVALLNIHTWEDYVNGVI